ncbi:MAG: TraR/DksA family transcriptional regulator, partial [Deltaproteobacteria bacterium]
MEDTRKIFLEQLISKKREFEISLERLRRTQKEYNDESFGENIADEFDNAQREISVFNNYSLIAKKIKELRNVNRLIEKVSRDENFGVCEECGNPIPAARLLIVPEATLCVECQRELEKLDHARNLVVKASPGFRERIEGRGDQDETDGLNVFE